MRPIDVQVFPPLDSARQALVGVNGEKLMHSQAYKSLASAEHVADGTFQVVLLQA